MEDTIVVGIDIGTTKICTLIARVEGERSMRILGVGIEPSMGIKKGTIVDLVAASQAIAHSIDKAQRPFSAVFAWAKRLSEICPF